MTAYDVVIGAAFRLACFFTPSVALAIPPLGKISTKSVEVLLIDAASAQEPVGNHRVAQIPPPCEFANSFLLLGNVLVQVNLDLFEFPRRQQPLRGNVVAESPRYLSPD